MTSALLVTRPLRPSPRTKKCDSNPTPILRLTVMGNRRVHNRHSAWVLDTPLRFQLNQNDSSRWPPVETRGTGRLYCGFHSSPRRFRPRDETTLLIYQTYDLLLSSNSKPHGTQRVGYCATKDTVFPWATHKSTITLCIGLA